MSSGERQEVTRFEDARADHRARYVFAEEVLAADARANGGYGIGVIDAFCGVGYGTAYVAERHPTWFVAGVDGDAEAINTAQRYFRRDNTHYVARRWRHNEQKSLPPDLGVDAVISFESVEHVENPHLFLRDMAAGLRVGGLFIFSTPNNDLLPHLPGTFPHHVRHMSLSETLAMSNLLWVEDPPRLTRPITVTREVWYGQNVYSLNEAGRVSGVLDDVTQCTLNREQPGQFTVVVCRRTA